MPKRVLVIDSDKEIMYYVAAIDQRGYDVVLFPSAFTFTRTYPEHPVSYDLALVEICWYLDSDAYSIISWLKEENPSKPVFSISYMVHNRPQSADRHILLPEPNIVNIVDSCLRPSRFAGLEKNISHPHQ